MKKLERIVSVLLLTLTLSFIAVGCSNTEVISDEDNAIEQQAEDIGKDEVEEDDI